MLKWSKTDIPEESTALSETPLNKSNLNSLSQLLVMLAIQNLHLRIYFLNILFMLSLRVHLLGLEFIIKQSGFVCMCILCVSAFHFIHNNNHSCSVFKTFNYLTFTQPSLAHTLSHTHILSISVTALCCSSGA